MPQKPKKTDDGPARIWGGYVPDIYRSYPDPPVRGSIVTSHGRTEFRPDKDGPRPRHRLDYAIDNWITGQTYDLVVCKMRETADDAIRAKRAEIARLERFIDDN